MTRRQLSMVSIVARAVPLCLVLLGAVTSQDSGDNDFVVDDNDPNPICTDIKKNQQTQLRGSFILHNHKKNVDILYIVTYNWMVYEVPTSSFDNHFGQMDLRTINATSIENKWEAFKNSSKFQNNIKQKNNVILFGLHCKVVYIIPLDNIENTLLFNFKENTLEPKSSNMEDLTHDINMLLQVDTEKQAISMGKRKNEENFLQQFTLDLDADGLIKKGKPHGPEHYLYYEDDANKTHIKILILDVEKSANSSPVSDWKNLTLIQKRQFKGGFNFKNFWHIFSDDEVFLFATSSEQDDPLFNISSVYMHGNIIQKTWKDYFVCDDNSSYTKHPYPTLFPTTTPSAGPTNNGTEEPDDNKGIGWWAIALVAIIVIVLIGIVIYLVNKDEKETSQPLPPPKPKNQAKEKSKSKSQNPKSNAGKSSTGSTGKSSTGSAGKSSTSKSKSSSKAGSGIQNQSSTGAPHSSTTN